MSVWWTIPSARPVAEVGALVAIWRERGYRIALWRDDPTPADLEALGADYVSVGPYPGYARAVNEIVASVLMIDSDCSFCVAGGDDTTPDPNHTADEIAAQLTEHFGGTFGVMQPTGDRFAGGSIDRIAGSPWMGREWCTRAHQGTGPMWHEFTHMFGDEALKWAAEQLGVYWARPDLTHFHRHFQRETEAIDSTAVAKPIPAHLVRWNTPEHWRESKAIFDRLRGRPELWRPKAS